MRILVCLVFKNGTCVFFTKSGDFDVDLWIAANTELLEDIGVKGVESEPVGEDYYLPWEEA